ncbi:MAG: ABC transporter permease [Caldilinea sp. CFX5]|nr:ABC transporter permease [Caldilinea sp. CFX5]
MTSHATFLSHRPLLYAWVIRTIRARYKQSLLGGLWAIVQPTVATLIFSIVFTYFVPVDTGGIPYLVFSYAALAPWTFFTTALSDMVESLVINMNLVSKIYFPREILPIAALLARLLDFGIASVLLVALILYFGVAVAPLLLLYLPAVLAVQLALALGLGFMGAALNVFYRDVKHLIALVIQVWLYATPIIYPVQAVPAWVRPYYFLNPMTGIIESYRDILLRQQAPGTYLLVSLGLAAVILVLGYRFFKRVEFQFADVV